MKKYIFFLIISGFLFSSCAMHVNRMITKSYAPHESDSPVEIFFSRDEIPEQTETLGVIVVRDGGMTIRCDFATVINIVKDETRKVGGNAAFISEHIPPSIWRSTCHQMTAVLLKTGDFIQRNDTVENVSTAEIVAPRILRPERTQPSMQIGISVGYGWRTARISPNLPAAERHYIGQLMSGIHIDASFDYFINDFNGIGIMYSTYRASADGWATINGQSGGLLTRDAINFIAPTYTARLIIGESFFLNLKVGIGYIGYVSRATFLRDQTTVSGATLGTHFGIGAEYKVTEVFGLFANVAATSGVLNRLNVDNNGRKSVIRLESGQGEGLGHANVSLGFRLHFN